MKVEKIMTIKERLSKRFTNWAEKNMSYSAKEVMIKSGCPSHPYLCYEGV
jgi:hypothetical protein